MIAAQYTQGVGLKIGEVPIPKISDDELLLRVEATSICGTDLKIVRQGHRKLRPGQTITLGHEFVGTLEQVGSRVTLFSRGQRVGLAPNIGCGHCEMCGRGLMNMCQQYSAFGIDRDGSHTEYVRIPAEAIAQGNVIPISAEVSPADAALAEPLSCVVNGLRVAQVGAGDLVLIYGAGPMGLLNLMLAQTLGAAQVLVVDPDRARLQQALALGAAATLNPTEHSVPDWVARETEGRGVDAVITAAPSAAVQQEAVGLLAPFGRLCLFAGLPKSESAVPLDTNTIHYRNLIVSGMTGGAPQDYQTALKLIEGGRVPVRRIVSHVFALSEMERAYELALSGRGMKVVLAAKKEVGRNGPAEVDSSKTAATAADRARASYPSHS